VSFKPIKQFNAILTQEYFEPTISWALRVVLALNVPLILLPLWEGFSYKIIWAAFGAYMISLTDYRGLHSKKIVIQSLQSLLIVFSALLGMWVTHSLWLSLVVMFLVGLFAAIIRNWNDYGTNVGVAVGFFFLFGLSNPVSFAVSWVFALYVFIGAVWAILITVFSFPFRPSNPVKRSVAKIWKANTELLDTLIEKLNVKKTNFSEEIVKKEMAVRTSINHSINLFARQSTSTKRINVQHYDLMMDLRRHAALFSASLSSMHEEMTTFNSGAFLSIKNSVLHKTLSSFAQASARMAIVIYTSRPEDFTLAKVRVQRCALVIELFNEACASLSLKAEEQKALDHFNDTLTKAYDYLTETVALLEKKLSLKQSDYFESYKLSFSNFTTGIENWVLIDFIKNLLWFNSEQFKYALRVSVALCAGVFIFKYFRIDHGYWIPLTLMIVIQPYYGATRKKGIERIIGTLAGVILGGCIMLLPLPHTFFIALLLVVSFFVAYFLRNNYKVGVFFVTIMMVVLMQISDRGSLELIGWRILSTLIGAVLAIVAGYAFWPVWEKERFPVLMAQALMETKNYLRQVLKYYNNELPAHQNWHKNRQLAEAANSVVFASVQRMYEEPKHIQEQVDTYIAIVGANIRMTREITSIVLVANESKSSENIENLTRYHHLSDQFFDLFIQRFSDLEDETKVMDFKEIKSCLSSEVFLKTEALQFIKTELEKVIFELEALTKLIPNKKTETKSLR
jgi:uncharacterized membrane protein YccC